MLGYNGGSDGLSSSSSLTCIGYVAFNLPYSQLIVGKRVKRISYIECLDTLTENYQNRLVIGCVRIISNTL